MNLIEIAFPVAIGRAKNIRRSTRNIMVVTSMLMTDFMTRCYFEINVIIINNRKSIIIPIAKF